VILRDIDTVHDLRRTWFGDRSNFSIENQADINAAQPAQGAVAAFAAGDRWWSWRGSDAEG